MVARVGTERPQALSLDNVPILVATLGNSSRMGTTPVKIYLSESGERWWAIAPEIPGATSEDAPSRDEALERCRQRAAEEQEALGRLGFSLNVDPEEVVIDYTGRWWHMPEWLAPVPPALRDAVVLRMDEIVREVDAFLSELALEEWDRRPGAGWSIRMVLDHMAGGFGIGLRRFELWPLEANEAHALALDELGARLATLAGQRVVVTQCGMNSENGRVRWTPRKVLRVVAALQGAWHAHIEEGVPRPGTHFDHVDREDDDEPISAGELSLLTEQGASLMDLADRKGDVHAIAVSYRYYRDRLRAWPEDPVERWRAMGRAFRDRLVSLDETELALVRLVPDGSLATVNQNLPLGISHLREHLEQMQTIRTAMRPPGG